MKERHRHLTRWAVIALLLLFFAQVTTAAQQTSLTSDEGPQLTSAYAYLTTGDTHLIAFDGHPPLAKVLNTLPLLPIPDLGSPVDAPDWNSNDPISLLWVTQQFLYPYEPVDRIATAARVPVALWGVLLAALVYRWAAELFDPRAGLGALFLVTFDPNLLAHAGVATNDLAVTTACFAALFTFWRCMRDTNWTNILLAGITLGIAQGIKLNALILLPIEGLLLLGYGLKGHRDTQRFSLLPVMPSNNHKRHGSVQKESRDISQSVMPSEVEASRSFDKLRMTGPLVVCSRDFLSSAAEEHVIPSAAEEHVIPSAAEESKVRITLESIKAGATHLRKCIAPGLAIWVVAFVTLWASYGFEIRQVPGFPFPLPAGTHLLLWSRVTEATGGGHPAFLMGELSTEGWWHYFPVVFALKTPIPTLLAVLVSVGLFITGRRRDWRDELALGLFVVLYTAATVFSRLNIGYRHLLPVLPFVYVFAARVFGKYERSQDGRPRGRGLEAIVGLLALWLVLGTVTLWPFHLSYFNEFAGGPDQGYRYLVDSNTDWGQAHKALARYMQENHIEHVYLSTYIEFGAVLEHYGINYTPLPPLNAAPGMLPARFNPAPGVYAISTTTLQGVLTADPYMYNWFRNREPDAKIGHVLFVYNVPETTPGQDWVAQCITPVSPLVPPVIAEGFGNSELRRAYFDCTQGWLLPDGGKTPGWYVLAYEATTSDNPLTQMQLRAGKPSYVQEQNALLPPFAIYETEQRTAQPDHKPKVPVTVGQLEFLGYAIYQEGKDAPQEIWTYWQVNEPVQRLLSLMLHVMAPDGSAAAVSDGLSVPVDNWQTGDVIIQRHLLPPKLPPGEYTLISGAYWLDTVERWPVEIDGEAAGDYLTLSPGLTIAGQ